VRLALKPQVVVAGKMDLAEAREQYPAIRARFAERGIELWAISAATGEGVPALMREVGRRWRALRAAADQTVGLDDEIPLLPGAVCPLDEIGAGSAPGRKGQGERTR
jgi:50S ribosomal subunit-associated GTPase HflX